MKLQQKAEKKTENSIALHMSLGTFYATWQAAKPPGRAGRGGLWLWQFKIMNHTQTVAD